MKGRPLTSRERDLVDAFLAHDFEGVDALRVQARELVAVQGCSCGCGTIDLMPLGRDLPRSAAPSPVPATGDVSDEHGQPVGGVLLFLAEGLLSSLEVYWYEEPLPLPSIDRVAWTSGTAG